MELKPQLSKSQYIKGLQCPKALWFYRFRKGLKPEIDAATQARFDTGNEIGLLAQRYFSNGVEVVGDYRDITDAEKLTRHLIEEGHTILYEATAISPFDGTHARIDIFRKLENSDAWDLIEVKSSTSVKDYHIDDMSLQYYAFSAAGYQINKCYMMVIDNTYTRNGEIDLASLFRLEDISDRALKKQGAVRVQIKNLLDTLDPDNEPKEEIGARCSSPFECEYKSHCWKKVPEYSVFNVLSSENADCFVKTSKSYEIKDIPPNLIPGGIKRIDIEAHLSGNIREDRINITAFLKQLEYPLYFLDYETIAPAIPLYDGTRPYEQIPFQFSLHIQNSPNTALEHYEFLSKERSDPREALTRSLIELCGSRGSIIVYNRGFEAGCNERLGIALPNYSKELNRLNQRMVDLLIPFKKRWLYSPAQNGSASIKAVLPSFSTLDYKELGIAGGGEASAKYQAFAEGKISSEEADFLFEELSRYCSLDTYAMVLLTQKLREVSNFINVPQTLHTQ
jgi:hypothetical protein